MVQQFRSRSQGQAAVVHGPGIPVIEKTPECLLRITAGVGYLDRHASHQAKWHKDLRQADALIHVLATHPPEDLQEAWRRFRERRRPDPKGGPGRRGLRKNTNEVVVSVTYPAASSPWSSERQSQCGRVDADRQSAAEAKGGEARVGERSSIPRTGPPVCGYRLHLDVGGSWTRGLLMAEIAHDLMIDLE